MLIIAGGSYHGGILGSSVDDRWPDSLSGHISLETVRDELGYHLNLTR
jgi:hypothetical protein